MCTVCSNPSYVWIGNTCRCDTSGLPNCQSCSDPSTCASCGSGHYVNAGQCSPCDPLPNCIMCTSATVCGYCAPPYIIAGGVCIQCTIPNCSGCLNASYCGTCNTGAFTKPTGPGTQECDMCSTYFNTSICTSCSSSTTCTACVSTYYLKI